jgi:hypothetical protein
LAAKFHSQTESTKRFGEIWSAFFLAAAAAGGSGLLTCTQTLAEFGPGKQLAVAF